MSYSGTKFNNTVNVTMAYGGEPVEILPLDFIQHLHALADPADAGRVASAKADAEVGLYRWEALPRNAAEHKAFETMREGVWRSVCAAWLDALSGATAEPVGVVVRDGENEADRIAEECARRGISPERANVAVVRVPQHAESIESWSREWTAGQPPAEMES